MKKALFILFVTLSIVCFSQEKQGTISVKKRTKEPVAVILNQFDGNIPRDTLLKAYQIGVICKNCEAQVLSYKMYGSNSKYHYERSVKGSKIGKRELEPLYTAENNEVIYFTKIVAKVGTDTLELNPIVLKINNKKRRKAGFSPLASKFDENAKQPYAIIDNKKVYASTYLVSYYSKGKHISKQVFSSTPVEEKQVLFSDNSKRKTITSIVYKHQNKMIKGSPLIIK